jgi:hypothetical protein
VEELTKDPTRSHLKTAPNHPIAPGTRHLESEGGFILLLALDVHIDMLRGGRILCLLTGMMSLCTGDHFVFIFRIEMSDSEDFYVVYWAGIGGPGM